MPPSETSAFDEIDAALLLSDLRRLWRAWQERAAHVPAGPAVRAYEQAMHDLARVVDDRDRRRRAWIALRADVAEAVAMRLETDPDP